MRSRNAYISWAISVHSFGVYGLHNSGYRLRRQALLQAREFSVSGVSLQAILEGRRSRPQQLIEVLQDVQDLVGYIPQESMITVSQELGVPLIEVYRVANFYKAFSLEPRGRHLMTVCLGTACHVRGAARLVDTMHRGDKPARHSTSAWPV